MIPYLVVFGVLVGWGAAMFALRCFKSDPGPLTEKEKRALLRCIDGGKKR